MKTILSKTFKFSRCTISIYANEIVIVFIGNKKIYIKTLRMRLPAFLRPGIAAPRRAPAAMPQGLTMPLKRVIEHHRALPPRKKLAYSLGIALVIGVMAFWLYPASENQTTVNDEEAKNNLLKSAKTDYTHPRPTVKLVIHTHVVGKGESLHGIAKKYGVSVDTIVGTNNLQSYQFIKLGTVLKVPNKDGILYKMPRGAQLTAVAQRYKVSLRKIIDENNIGNPDFVAENTTLFIPDAKPLNIFDGFIWPTSSRRITCGYGWRLNPFDMHSREFHQGLDIQANYEWIKASRFGQVTYAGWLGGYGYAVVVAHPGGWKTLYGHLSRIIVRSGQYVKQGQPVAVSGNTGLSTGAHLHFEILQNGSPRNPYTYLAKNRGR